MDDDDVTKMIEEMVSETDTLTLTPGERRAYFVKGECSGWCWPLYIYIALAVLQLLAIPMMKVYDPTTKTYSAAPVAVKYRNMIVSIVWNVLVGFLMYYLCAKCRTGWSWFILLLPIILSVLLLIMIGGAAVAVNAT